MVSHRKSSATNIRTLEHVRHTGMDGNRPWSVARLVSYMAGVDLESVEVRFAVSGD